MLFWPAGITNPQAGAAITMPTPAPAKAVSEQLDRQGLLLAKLASYLADCDGGCHYCHELLDEYDVDYRPFPDQTLVLHL